MVQFSAYMSTPEVQTKIIDENFFAGPLRTSALNPVSAANPKITCASAMPFPSPEDRKGTAHFPVAITAQQDWVTQIEGKLDLLANKPFELIFGEKDDLVGTHATIARWLGHVPQPPVRLLPNANHFAQDDSPESFGLSLRRLMSQIDAANN